MGAHQGQVVKQKGWKTNTQLLEQQGSECLYIFHVGSCPGMAGGLRWIPDPNGEFTVVVFACLERL